jgi:phage gpG-like protein
MRLTVIPDKIDIKPDFQKFARRLGNQFLDNIDRQFSQSVDPYGSPWVPSKKPEGKTLIKTSTLRRSFVLDVASDGSSIDIGVAGPASQYAGLLHFGTGPTVLVPKNKKALRFVLSDGTVVFAKKVNLPGLPQRLLVPIQSKGAPTRWVEQAQKFAANLLVVSRAA